MKTYVFNENEKNPLVKKILDSLEAVGVRPEEMKISEKGHIHIVLSRIFSFFCIIKGNTVHLTPRESPSTLFLCRSEPEFNEMIGSVYSTLYARSLCKRHIYFRRKSDISKDPRVMDMALASGSLYEVPSILALLKAIRSKKENEGQPYWIYVLKISVSITYRTNFEYVGGVFLEPDFVAAGRSFILGDSPQEVYLEYLCEKSQSIEALVEEIQGVMNGL